MCLLECSGQDNALHKSFLKWGLIASKDLRKQVYKGTPLLLWHGTLWTGHFGNTSVAPREGKSSADSALVCPFAQSWFCRFPSTGYWSQGHCLTDIPHITLHLRVGFTENPVFIVDCVVFSVAEGEEGDGKTQRLWNATAEKWHVISTHSLLANISHMEPNELQSKLWKLRKHMSSCWSLSLPYTHTESSFLTQLVFYWSL